MPHDVDYQVTDLDAKVEQFCSLVASHDLTYTFSDDSRSYDRGRAQLEAIERLKAEIPKDRAVAIWNNNVDRKLAEPYRADFYWPAS